MHLGIIPDGNRRFGKENKKDGHFEGMKNILKIIAWFSEKRQTEINELTFFCFSEENWKRSDEEVDGLMKMFELILVEVDHFITQRKLSKNAEMLISDEAEVISVSKIKEIYNEIEVNFAITNFENFSKEIKEKIISFTDNHKQYFGTEHKTYKRINLCVSYTGKSEIVNAVNNLIKTNRIFTIENIESELLVKSFPDLVIRTSGEQRLSGFLPWQTCYSEFMFLDKHWPEISISDLENCIEMFKKRNRRFGK